MSPYLRIQRDVEGDIHDQTHPLSLVLRGWVLIILWTERGPGAGQGAWRAGEKR